MLQSTDRFNIHLQSSKEIVVEVALGNDEVEMLEGVIKNCVPRDGPMVISSGILNKKSLVKKEPFKFVPQAKLKTLNNFSPENSNSKFW